MHKKDKRQIGYSCKRYKLRIIFNLNKQNNSSMSFFFSKQKATDCENNQTVLLLKSQSATAAS